MTDIRDFLDKASNLSVQQAWISGFVNNKMLQLEILELIKTRLRETGTNSFGQVIGTYSPFTEKINPKKEAGTHYTFDDTGEFLP